MIGPSVSIEEVKSTLPTQTAAKELAAALVEKRLAACVQIVGPITSIYGWRGELNCDEEFCVVCKTTPARLSQLIDYVRSHHPYEVPEILTTRVQASSEYASWLFEQVESSATESK